MFLTVRRVRSDEALPLREIRLRSLLDAPEAFTTTHAEMIDKPLAFWADRVATNARGDTAAGFIAERDAAWIGMVAGYHPEPTDPQVELVSMWVAPEGRGTGVGQALVDSVIAWARDLDAPSVGLWVVRGNDPAVRLYQRCGFVETPEFVARPSDPCSDEIRMTFTL